MVEINVLRHGGLWSKNFALRSITSSLNAMAGLRRLRIDELNIETTNALVVGIVLGKSAPRYFHARVPGGEGRGVCNFTIRDSSVDCINCSAWGSLQFINSVNAIIHVGDIVDVMSPRIKTRQLDDRNEQYLPQVSSPFHLIINERQSEITIHRGDDYVDYLPLLHIPTKPPASFITLAEVQNTSQNIKDDVVDLLVAIKILFPPRTIKTKRGDEFQCRDISVVDQTSTVPFKITLWDDEIIKRSDTWKSRETILFISDVKLEWSDFTRSVVGRINTRTILTEDPQTSEAKDLEKFISTASLQTRAVIDDITHKIPDLRSIRNVMTIQQILNKASFDDFSQFTGLVYATVTHFDIDGFVKVISTKCGGCGSFLKSQQSMCDNVECSLIMSEMLGPEVDFDIRIMLSDHTGSLNGCRLTGKIAEAMLKCKADDFLKMSVVDKGILKWKYLLERCVVRLLVMKGPIVSILSCDLSDPNEVISKLPDY